MMCKQKKIDLLTFLSHSFSGYFLKTFWSQYFYWNYEVSSSLVHSQSLAFTRFHSKTFFCESRSSISSMHMKIFQIKYFVNAVIYVIQVTVELPSYHLNMDFPTAVFQALWTVRQIFKHVPCRLHWRISKTRIQNSRKRRKSQQAIRCQCQFTFKRTGECCQIPLQLSDFLIDGLFSCQQI